MRRGHGLSVMDVLPIMALVMASVACSVEWRGVPLEDPSMTEQAPSMTGAPASPTIPPPSMTSVKSCLVVMAFPGGDGKLNLRGGPGTSYRVITTLHDGQALVMEGQSGEWYAVTVVMDEQQLSGYVHSSYVEACE